MATTLVEVSKVSGEELRALPGWRVASTVRVAYTDCCLIIATYNRAQETMELMEALSRRDDAPGEVVIADGSSQPDLYRLLRSWSSKSTLPFDLVYVRCPAGLTRQRNIGIDISTRDYVFFLDDDSRPLENYFREVRQVFIEDLGKRIGAVGGSIVNEMDRPLSRRWRLRLAIGLVPRVEPMTYDSCGTSTPKGLIRRFQGLRRVDILPGCAFTFRREVLEKQRFSSFFEGYSQGEDLEMSLRVGAEWELACCGDAEVLHHAVPGGRPPSFDKGSMEVRNKFVIWGLHRPRTRLIDRVRFWGDVGLLIAFDVLHFVRRPWRASHLCHAAGLISGAFRCVFVPPQYSEPMARKEYRLALEA